MEVGPGAHQTRFTTTRVPSTSTTWIGVPTSMKSPSETTST